MAALVEKAAYLGDCLIDAATFANKRGSRFVIVVPSVPKEGLVKRSYAGKVSPNWGPMGIWKSISIRAAFCRINVRTPTRSSMPTSPRGRSGFSSLVGSLR
jgi:hypothetical protein